MSRTNPSVSRFLARLRAALSAGHVVITRKAAREATDELGLDRLVVFEVLAELDLDDFNRTVPSSAVPGDVVWVFTPAYDTMTLWIRLVERNKVIVVSFHEA